MPRFEEIPRVHIIEREEMPMNKTKKTLRKILAVVLSLSMMLSMTAISPKKADAFMKADVTEIKSSDMSELLSHYWNYKLEDNKLTINITDTEAEKNVQAAIAGGATKAYYQAGLDLYIDNVATGTSTAQPLTSGNFDGNTCTISQDVSSIAQTINTLGVSVSLVTTTKVGLKTTKKATLCYNFPIYLEKENGKISIYSPYGAAAVKALEDFNANYKPENYLKTRTFTNIACKSFEKIVEKAKELTKDCKNDGEKIKIIHDWICTNVAYNYPAIQGTTSGNTTDIDTSYKYGEKYGIDIFGDAIDMARENAALAGEKINFIHRDYFDFKHDYKFDEIVTNMPVKGKKAKEDMDAFYARFFEKSKSLLAEDGIIIMYSNEVGFVKKQLRLQPCYRLIQEYTVRKKDSYCLFIIGMK